VVFLPPITSTLPTPVWQKTASGLTSLIGMHFFSPVRENALAGNHPRWPKTGDKALAAALRL